MWVGDTEGAQGVQSCPLGSTALIGACGSIYIYLHPYIPLCRVVAMLLRCMAGTIVSTFADDRYPSHAAVLAAIQDLPALQPWMYAVQPLKMVLPQERVYDENGFLLFPSVDDFVEQPASFVNMSTSKRALMSFKLVASSISSAPPSPRLGWCLLRSSRSSSCWETFALSLPSTRYRRGFRDGPQLDCCCGRRARQPPLRALAWYDAWQAPPGCEPSRRPTPDA